ncbi:MAG: DUF2270 domain-containing protein [Anaerolineae bacterium]
MSSNRSSQSVTADEDQTTSQHDQAADSVWTFRGYRISPSEFTSAMAHFYRGEMSRSNTWRMRLDHTTNWAVVTTAAVLTFTFSDPTHPHVVLVLNSLLAALFLFIEARRYRYYELWAYRVRLMETDFFGAMLAPPFAPGKDWAQSLVENLLQPQFPVSVWEALGRRLRRNYIWVFLILALSWVIKVALHPTPTTLWSEFVQRAAIGPLPGPVLLWAGALFNAALVLIALLTVGLQESAGEVLPRHETFAVTGHLLHDLAEATSRILPGEGWPLRRPHHLTFVITKNGRAVADRLLGELNRGVTALRGTGMFTGQPRDVLLCALAPTEVAHFKSLVYAADPNAFVVVNPAEEVLGERFHPLSPARIRKKS